MNPREAPRRARASPAGEVGDDVVEGVGVEGRVVGLVGRARERQVEPGTVDRLAIPQ